MKMIVLCLAVIVLFGCATPRPTYHQAYSECMVRTNNRSVTLCDIEAGRARDGISMQASSGVSGDGGAVDGPTMTERMREVRQDLYNKCLSGQPLSMNCSY